MKGNTYKTPEGKEHKVLDFDKINKMVYIHIIGGQHRWVHESEYSQWALTDTANMRKIYVPDIPAQMIEEPKNNDDAVQVETTNEIDVRQQARDGEGVGNEDTESKITSEESEVKVKEKVKVKRKTTKKEK